MSIHTLGATYGRLLGLLFILGSTLLTTAISVGILLLGRVIVGLRMGCRAILFQFEMSPPSLRGVIIRVYHHS